jgi:hypothetical protein
MSGEHGVMQQLWEWQHGASCSGDQGNSPHDESRILPWNILCKQTNWKCISNSEAKHPKNSEEMEQQMKGEQLDHNKGMTTD